MNRLIFIIAFQLTSNILQAQNSTEIIISDDIHLVHLTDSIYVHITWDSLENFRCFSSNGLVLIKNGEALLIDTPITNTKTEQLATFLQNEFGATIKKLIIGHFHNDCMGGLPYLKKLNVESIANQLTVDICKKQNLPIPSSPFSDLLIFDFHGEPVECRYFGGGHTIDNITVWLPQQKILFGGCLIKSSNSRALGNLADAVVKEWDTTVQKLIVAYPEIQIVIPGHGNYGGTELLQHTIELVERYKASQ